MTDANIKLMELASTQEMERVEPPSDATQQASIQELTSQYDRACRKKRLCLIALLALPFLIVLLFLLMSGFLAILLGIPLMIFVGVQYRKYRTQALDLLDERRIALRQPAPQEDVRRVDRKFVFWTFLTGVLAAIFVVSAAVIILAGVVPAISTYLDAGLVALGLAMVLSLLMAFAVFPKQRSVSLRYHLLHRRIDAGKLAVSARTEVPSDRPPVIYLRSFDDDERASRRLGDLTEEEHIAAILAHFGPFVAVGRPGESLPHVGARRFYVDDSNWKEQVQGLIVEASLVVLRTGLSTGVRWELDTALSCLTPDKLMIVVDNKIELESMLGAIKQVHPTVDTTCKVGKRSVGSILGFVSFNSDWTISFHTIRKSSRWIYARQYDSYAGPSLAHTLHKVFELRGVKWPRPKLSIVKIALELVFGCLFVLVFILTIVR